MARTIYDPRPKRWPQVSVKSLLAATTLAAVLSGTVLPSAVMGVRGWLNAPEPSPWYQNDGELMYFPPGPEFILSEEAAAQDAYKRTHPEDASAASRY